MFIYQLTKFIIRYWVKVEYSHLFYYVLMQAILNFTASIIVDVFFKTNNIWLYQLNCFLSFVILFSFFKKFIFFRVSNLAINIFAAVFMCFLAIIIFFESQNAFNSLSYTTVSIAITFLCLNYYWFLISKMPTESILKNPFFFIVTGLLIYYSSNILVFASYRFLTIEHVQTKSFWILWKFHNFMLTLMCIFILKGFTCVTSPKTRS